MLEEELIGLVKMIQHQKAEGAGKIKGSYIRVGDVDLPMTDYEIYSFESYRKHLHDDERIIERAPLSLLNEDKLNLYISDRKNQRPMFARLSMDQTYEMLNISRDGIPTLAAVLNFGIYPQGLLPQLGITAVVVPGYELGAVGSIGERFVDNKRIEGTISEMIEDALSFCRRNMKIKTVVDSGTGKRRDIAEYPINAVREIILNALIHRDYSIHTEGTPVQIIFFTDRLEIHSPGTLYGRLTVALLGNSRPDLRNPALATMAESLTEAENRYSGIPTIRREMKEHNLPEPLFENRRNEFVVTLYNAADSPAFSDDVSVPLKSDYESMLLAFCTVPKSRAEISGHLGIQTFHYVMKHYLEPLIDEGKIAMTLPHKPKSKLQKYYTVN